MACLHGRPRNSSWKVDECRIDVNVASVSRLVTYALTCMMRLGGCRIRSEQHECGQMVLEQTPRRGFLVDRAC